METARTYSPLTIAKWFLWQLDPQSDNLITPLKLQKLVYYAQAWSLVLYDRILFRNKIEAWTRGPAVRVLYDTYRKHGLLEPLPQPKHKPEIDEDAEWVLSEVWRVYGIYSGQYLEELTHKEEPWIEARGGLPSEMACDRPISLDTMKRYYTEQMNQAREQEV